VKKSRVVLITNTERTAQGIYKQLNALLGSIIDFEYFSYEKGISDCINANLVLVPTQEIAGITTKFLMPGTDILVIRRTLYREEWEKVIAIPPGTKCLLVNTGHEVTMQTIALLYELGAKQVEFIPYYPGLEVPPEENIVITPNEVSLVPPHIEKIINIGDRAIDSSSVFDILSKLNLFNKETSEILVQLMAKTIPRSPGLIGTLSNITKSKQHLELLLEILSMGVVAYDEKNQIMIFNKSAEEIFKIQPWKVIGTPLEDLLSRKGLKDINQATEINDEVFKLDELHYMVNKYPLVQRGNLLGGVLTFKECNELERLNYKFKQDIKIKGHNIKYTFKDILGKSSILLRTITIAEKIASGDGDVLIEGESGTGKELFAHAIHNSSKRKNFPFVAFNCAALTGSLLESELFGYDDGAFTGARKGGKAGLFELADKGTIFLDEIGDIPFETQAKLLRVLQEREIIRVGGTNIIPIDIRVIAATNQPLHKLVEEGKFRKDLYYRLNVLNLRLPPLRERNEDVSYLVEYFMKLKGFNKDVPRELMNILQEYYWPGNVRELKNCIEYMVNTFDQTLTIENLPIHILDTIKNGFRGNSCYPKELTQIGDPNELTNILRILKEAYDQGERVGRRSISDKLKNVGIILSEQEIRTRLKKMEEKGLIYVSKGRGGTKITPKGSKVLMNS